MTQRTWAAVAAVPLLAALALWTAVAPLPFVSYAPGLTVNVLGKSAGKPIITVQGHPVYRDGGALRMTTVSVTERAARLDLFTLMRTWFTRDDAVYPFSSVYPTVASQEQDAQQGQIEMVTSQDSATASALRQLGYHIRPRIEIVSVDKGLPADGHLQVRDLLVSVAGTKVTPKTDVGKLVAGVPQGQPVPIVVDRDGKRVSVSLTPTRRQGHPVVGIRLEIGYVFPFQVTVNIPEEIGGPSAGLMFALSIYDTLTPGSLTDGQVVAGTGTIDAQGHVGEIGGIQQKIAASRKIGAKIFFVPAKNCADALGADHGSMRLVEASTLRQAITSLKAWTADHDAQLPTCQAGS